MCVCRRSKVKNYGLRVGSKKHGLRGGSKGHGLIGGSTVDAPEFCKSVFSMLVFHSIRFFHAGFSTNQVVSYGNFSQSVFVPMSFAH